MLRPLRSKGVRSQTSTTTSVPAPTGGWNVLDSLAEMPANDAVILDNLVPYPSKVVLRNGYTTQTTGISGNVNSLMAYNAPTVNYLFAAAGAYIYDCTTTGAVGAAVATGFTSDKWQHVNYSTPGGNYMYLANGVDNMQLYDGTNWTSVNGSSTPAISGVSTSDIINLNVFKTRLWMVEKNSLRIWYLPVNSIGGTASSLDFSSIFKLGGYLVAMGTWSLDAGQGLDDYAVFITSQGEVAVYKGIDPSNAATWEMVGVFTVGAPLGRRCFVKYAGDLLLISRDGLLPMSQALMSSRVNTKIALTNKIQQAISSATTSYSSNFGWETIIYPSENLLLVNIPVSVTETHQYVMHTITGAWCRFKGWNAFCWERFNDQIYFGTDSGVNHAWSGVSDNGANIEAEVLQAFNDFENPSQTKHFTMARPVIGVNAKPNIAININVDFDVQTPISFPNFTPFVSGIWDVGLWDSALWGGDVEARRDWISVNGIGRYGALHMVFGANSFEFEWDSTDFVYETGGVL